VVVGAEADEGDGDSVIVEEESQGGLDGGFLFLGFGEVEQFGVLWDDATAEGVHYDDGATEIGGGLDSCVAVGEVHYGIAEQDSLEGVILHEFFDVGAGHMGRDADVADEAFVFEFFELFEHAVGFSIVVFIEGEQVPDVVEVDIVEIHSFQ